MKQQQQQTKPHFINKHDDVWKLYRSLGKFCEKTNTLPDAAAVKKAKYRSVPTGNTPMIF